jgi:hypothetical protein
MPRASRIASLRASYCVEHEKNSNVNLTVAFDIQENEASASRPF